MSPNSAPLMARPLMPSRRAIACAVMDERGWISAEWGTSENNRRAKYYQLTAQGRQQLRAKATTWAQYAAAVTRVLGVAEPSAEAVP